MEGERGERRDVYQYRYHHQHDYTPSSSSSISLSTPPKISTPLPDDLSLFLHHLLLRSSSPSMANNDGSSSSFSPPHPPSSIYRLLRSSFAGKEGAFSDPADDGFLSSVYFSGNVGSAGGGVNVPSSSVGASENETDHEYDCESEEGLEALVEEGQTKHPNQRSSSKRSRAAEVHNLSEKRRRSRINEKMKALQNLIPNSNKTDKASMLDEAIEYLKQLQLQVQMLSMRNGLSLHPMCLPGVLQPIQLTQTRMGGVGEENETFHMNVPDTLPPNEENVFCLPNQSIASNQPSVPNMSNIICSETSFGLESHFGSFQLQASNEEICREDMVPHQLSNVNRSNTNPLA